MSQSPGDNKDPSVLLTLSGGGYRAMLFHVGALWKLNEIGELRRLAHAASSAFPPFLAPLVLRPGRVTWRPYLHKFSSLRSYDQLAIRVAEVPEGELDSFRRRVVLVDGGVADNLGVLPLWECEGVGRRADPPGTPWR
jgi:hypothetical protein